MEVKKVLGFRKFNSKAGKPCCILGVAAPFTSMEIDRGACGSCVDEIWLPESVHDLVTSQVIGKSVYISYMAGHDGRAYVEGVEFK